jgi:hypothetical protein
VIPTCAKKWTAAEWQFVQTRKARLTLRAQKTFSEQFEKVLGGVQGLMATTTKRQSVAMPHSNVLPSLQYNLNAL